MKLSRLPRLLLTAVAACACSTGMGAESTSADAKGLAVFSNQTQDFQINLRVDRDDCVYRLNELMRATVTSQSGGYLYLLHIDAADTVNCVFPNDFQKDNEINANEVVTVPSPQSNFQLRVVLPLGNETLKAIVSQRRLETLEAMQLAKRPATPIGKNSIKGLIAELAKHEWAQAALTMKTVELNGPMTLQQSTRQFSGEQLASGEPGLNPNLFAGKDDVPTVTQGISQQQGSVLVKPKPNSTQRPAVLKNRVGLFVGLDTYQSQSVPPLQASVNDARRMAETMLRLGEIDEAIVLVNQDATLENIRKAFADLRSTSSEGSTVFIYWSGHGDRCADLDGDEKADGAGGDGLDEYLLTYNGDRSSVHTIRQTMLLDDEHYRLVQSLGQRHVVLIHDTCFSGGQAKVLDSETFSRGFAESHREKGMKSASRTSVTMLASSKSNQVSFERPDGVHSVMTGYLVDLLKTRRSLTVSEAYDSLKVEVPNYVQSMYPGATQTPELTGSDAGRIYLRRK